jgi:NHLM bacteriocin system ABC transporter peptidase/ATP-binding protein
VKPSSGPAQVWKFRKRRARAPVIFQADAAESGAVALAMVLAAHGRWVPLVELRSVCGVSRHGSHVSHLVRAARSYGLEAEGRSVGVSQLANVALPAIVLVNQSHFVVLVGFDRRTVYLNDPAQGRRNLSFGEFAKIYSGVALELQPLATFQRGGEHGGLLTGLIKRFEGAKSALAFVLVAGICLVLPSVVIASFTRIFIDHYLIEGQRLWVGSLILFMVATAIVQGGLVWASETVFLRLSTRTSIRESSRFVWTMLRLPIGFFSQRNAGNIAARPDLAPELGWVATSALSELLVPAITASAYVVIMLTYSPLLTAVTVGIVVANMAVFVPLWKRLEELQRRASLEGVKLEGKTMHALQTIESIKALGAESAFHQAWSAQLAAATNLRQAIGRSSGLIAAVPDSLTQLGTLSVLLVGGWLVMNERLTLGMLIGFQLLQVGFAAPALQIMRTLLDKLQSARGLFEQFDDVSSHAIANEFNRDRVAMPAAQVGDESIGQSVPPRLSGRISIRGLSFGHVPFDPPLVDGFDLEVAAGSRVAIVGPSGCGKSTLCYLAAGLVEPWGGEIRLDGRSLAAIPRSVLRTSLAIVDQEIVLFAGTIRENLTMWDNTLPEERLIRAVRDAVIDDLIATRPGGIDGFVEEGGRNFSGGQRQRLEIARALATEPTILVLDEATSALDPVVERQVMENLRRRGCTCLIVAHRLSAIRDCDEIVVMDQGRTVERGTHEQLVAADGFYRRLLEA